MVSEVMGAFRAAAQCESARVSERFAVAREWATLHHDLGFLGGSSLEAHETAIGLLPRLAMLGLDVKSRQGALASNTDGLARNAAACAIREREFTKAIEFLEEGRAIFWSQALQLRTPVDELASSAPELAQKFMELSRVLERGSLRDISSKMAEPPERGISADREAVRYRQLHAEWLATVEEIRGQKGFQTFLRAKPFAELSAAAAHGPVVILIASELRSECDALIMRHSQRPVHIPLPQMSVEMAENLIKRMRALPGSSFPLARGDPDRHIKRIYSHDDGDPDSTFQEVLGTLWMAAVQPIFKVLHLEVRYHPIISLPEIHWGLIEI
jgi:hypothetical protein